MLILTWSVVRILELLTDPNFTFTLNQKTGSFDYTVETELKFAKKPPRAISGSRTMILCQMFSDCGKTLPPCWLRSCLIESLPDENELLIRKRDWLRTKKPAHSHSLKLIRLFKDRIVCGIGEKLGIPLETYISTQNFGLICFFFCTTIHKKTMNLFVNL